MLQIILISLFFIRCCAAFDFTFYVPADWKLANPTSYAPAVQVCFLDPKEGFSPSINLSVEKTDSSLTDYVAKSRKSYQRNPQAHWRDLGTFDSEAGKGRLIEIDIVSQSGKGRIWQYIVKKKDEIAVLTAASSTEEFKQHRDLFKKSFQSLRAVDNILDLIEDEKDKTQLTQLLSSGDLKAIDTFMAKHSSKGPCWHFLALRKCLSQIEKKK